MEEQEQQPPEQRRSFDGWVRNRFHVDSQDLQDIASHIDPLGEPDQGFSAVDDLFSWLKTDQQDATMQPAAASHADPFAAAMQGQLEQQEQQQAAAAAALPLPAQHGVASWQIAYLQQAMQPTDMQAAMPAQQQQAMYEAAGFPEAANMLPANYHPALLHQHTQQQQQFQSDLWAAAGDGAAGHASAQQLPLQHAGRSGPSASASSGSAAKKMQGSRAPTAAGTTTNNTKKAAAGGSRKPRKVTDAQRAAHKRFRMRRKEQVSSLAAEVAAKQEQLAALEAEHEALTAKARALDQLVASAGDSVLLMQHMEALSLGPNHHQQQQPHSLQAAPSSSSMGSISRGSSDLACAPLGPAATAAAEAEEAAAAATAAICGPADSSSGPQGASPAVPQLQEAAPVSTVAATTQGDSPGTTQGGAATAAADSMNNSRDAQGDTSASTAAAAAAAAAVLAGSSGSNGGAPSSPSANAAASLERLETAVRAALGRPLPQQPLLHRQQLELQKLEQLQQPVQHLQMQLRGAGPAVGPLEALQLQGTLPALQRLVKGLVTEIMQLVLQVSNEQVAAAAAAAAAGAGSVLGAAAAAAAAAAAGRQQQQQVSGAAARLQHIRQQVYGEFRAFAATNRIDMCLLYTLNLDTGALVRPPAGHWVTGAQLLMQRLDAQALQDIVMAHKLYTDALSKVQQQRRALLVQLHAALRDSTSANGRRYTNDSLYATTTLWSRTNAGLLLNAVDSNLRKEYVMEGVFQWSLNKLLPPLLAAELVVTSYPFLTDLHHIAEELRALIPSDLDPTPGVEAVEQQQRQEQQQQQQLQQLQQFQQQQQLLTAPVAAMPAIALQPAAYQMQQYGQTRQYGQAQQYDQMQQQQGWPAGNQLVPGTQAMALPFLSAPCS